MPNSYLILLITLKVFEILTPKAVINQKVSFYYRPKFNLGTEWNQEKNWSSLHVDLGISWIDRLTDFLYFLHIHVG